MTSGRFHTIGGVGALIVGAILLVSSEVTPVETTGIQAASQQAVNDDARVMALFVERVEAYVASHRKVQAGLDRLSDNATPDEIDTHQRMFGVRMAEARTGAKQGDLFDPQVQAVIRRLLERLFESSASRLQLRESVMDDNPEGQVALTVNGRYPDDVPLSTMPPAVLKNLPRIPEEVEYRFVGDALILLDPTAHIVVDFMPDALPE